MWSFTVATSLANTNAPAGQQIVTRAANAVRNHNLIKFCILIFYALSLATSSNLFYHNFLTRFCAFGMVQPIDDSTTALPTVVRTKNVISTNRELTRHAVGQTIDE